MPRVDETRMMTPRTHRPILPTSVLTRCRVATLALLAGSVVPAHAQLADPASGDAPARPVPTVIAPERSPRATPVSPGAPTPADALPGLGQQDVSVPPTRLVREGAFLVKRTGAVLRAPTGEWIVAWAKDTQPDAVDLPPMPLLPSRALARLQRQLGPDASRALVEVSGQVTQFRGRNYLLPTLIAVPRRPAGDAAETPSELPGTTPPARPDDDPRVLDLIRDLEENRPIPRAVTPTESDAAETPGLEEPDLLIDGRAIVQERGRLVRLASGHLVFQPDNDLRGGADGPAPLLLLPSRMLEQAEALYQRSADDAAVRVSGRTFAYGSTRYLLIESVHRERRTEINPGQ